MGLMINGQPEEISGLRVDCWQDDAALCLRAEDCAQRPKATWVRGIVLHTTKGIPGGRDHRHQVIRPGLGPTKDHHSALACYWARDGRCAGAHLMVDFDGTVACMADLQTQMTYHASQHDVNRVTIGIEIYQGTEAELYDGQLDAVVRLVDHLTRRFGIQRQFPWPYRGRPIQRIAAGGLDIVGIYGHRDVTDNRGQGDPGDAIFEKLQTAGYEPFDIDGDEDLDVWKQRQRALNLGHHCDLVVDGVPGPRTLKALALAGKAHGLWVARPGD